MCASIWAVLGLGHWVLVGSSRCCWLVGAVFCFPHSYFALWGLAGEGFAAVCTYPSLWLLLGLRGLSGTASPSRHHWVLPEWVPTISKCFQAKKILVYCGRGIRIPRIVSSCPHKRFLSLLMFAFYRDRMFRLSGAQEFRSATRRRGKCGKECKH